MPITEQEIQTVKEIVLNGARNHFPPTVQFHDANVTVRLNADEEEYFRVRLLYTAPTFVLDGHLMNTLFRVIEAHPRRRDHRAYPGQLHRVERSHQAGKPQVAYSAGAGAMIDPHELIATCYKLASQAATPPPSEADLRRATSTAYYAMFHTLAASNAGLIAGPPQSDLPSQAWERVYRGPDHRRARNNLRAVLGQLSPNGENFARTFIDLQDLRQEADYNPNFSITGTRSLNLIKLAETAISTFTQLTEEERWFIAVQSLFDRW